MTVKYILDGSPSTSLRVEKYDTSGTTNFSRIIGYLQGTNFDFTNIATDNCFKTFEKDGITYNFKQIADNPILPLDGQDNVLTLVYTKQETKPTADVNTASQAGSLAPASTPAASSELPEKQSDSVQKAQELITKLEGLLQNIKSIDEQEATNFNYNFFSTMDDLSKVVKNQSEATSERVFEEATKSETELTQKYQELLAHKSSPTDSDVTLPQTEQSDTKIDSITKDAPTETAEELAKSLSDTVRAIGNFSPLSSSSPDLNSRYEELIKVLDGTDGRANDPDTLKNAKALLEVLTERLATLKSENAEKDSQSGTAGVALAKLTEAFEAMKARAAASQLSPEAQIKLELDTQQYNDLKDELLKFNPSHNIDENRDANPTISTEIVNRTIEQFNKEFLNPVVTEKGTAETTLKELKSKLEELKQKVSEIEPHAFTANILQYAALLNGYNELTQQAKETADKFKISTSAIPDAPKSDIQTESTGTSLMDKLEDLALDIQEAASTDFLRRNLPELATLLPQKTFAHLNNLLQTLKTANSNTVQASTASDVNSLVEALTQILNKLKSEKKALLLINQKLSQKTLTYSN